MVPDKKEKLAVQTRQPKKKTQGIFDNLRPIQPHPVEEILGLKESQPEPTPPTSRTPPTPRTPGIAPERDFAKVANSIVREAIAGGHFIGKSKHLYDYLYSLTRGAIVPKRSVTVTKPALMRGSHIGSERTLLKNLAHLKAVGLVEVSYTDGKHEGNVYTVHLPEEVGLKLEPAPRTPPHVPHPRHARTELPSVPPVESGVGGVGSGPVESSTYEPSKTYSLRHEKFDDDDAALAALVATLKEAAKEITGKEVTLAESEKWKELADVLIAELRIAAARTTVSNVPAFLAEHLRRRLWKIDQRQAQAEGRELPDQASSLSHLDAKECPDCGGSNWHYPEGVEKGVRRCTHQKLKSEKA
ncbi:MAG TPA: hypothetical protein VF544_19325 [Pyrinomonadaceae bacterium]|jgi:hypothetical protein